MAQRRQIRLLPINVANKIAAGEVVERPASVVKELIENALDAGATRIEVVITAGGRKLISVADDGCGMDHDNALMCLEPQATSKIRDVDDIERIATYGFRGEAIPSIAAVSRFTIRTCAEGETTGTCVEVAGGQIQGVTEIGFPQGTTFEVRDLFFNVPARRKFLKSYQTEQTHIRTAFMLQALSHPETAMRFKADGREVWNLPGGATLEERVMELFGRDFIASMRPREQTGSNRRGDTVRAARGVSRPGPQTCGGAVRRSAAGGCGRERPPDEARGAIPRRIGRPRRDNRGRIRRPRRDTARAPRAVSSGGSDPDDNLKFQISDFRKFPPTHTPHLHHSSTHPLSTFHS